MFKFVHIADTHLDSAIQSNDKDRDFIINEMEKAFKGAVNLCIEEDCNALLIAGDLFDDERLSFKTELMLRECFEKLKNHGISVFYCLGNHDSKSSKIKRFKMGDNVHIFADETPRWVEVKSPEGNVVGVVAGIGYETQHVDYNLSQKFKSIKIENDIPVVAMLHTSLDIGGDKVYSPCTYADLAEFDFDYWALGHIHKTQMYGKNKPAIFPGCTCGRHFGETGAKGAYLVTLNKQGVSKYDFKELAGIAWHDIQVSGFEDVQDASDMQAICERKIAEIVNTDKKNMVRLTLTGQCQIYSHFTEEALYDLQESLTRRTGDKITLVNSLSSLINPQDYMGDKHLLSIALNMAEQAKNDDELRAQIIDVIKEQYKGLDGEESDEYMQSLFDDIDKKLCNVMIRQD